MTIYSNGYHEEFESAPPRPWFPKAECFLCGLISVSLTDDKTSAKCDRCNMIMPGEWVTG